MQKYVIVHFIDSNNVPHNFNASEWPLHITLLANFTLAGKLETLITKLDGYSAQEQSFVVGVDSEDLFGLNKNVAVSLIEPSIEIIETHLSLARIAISLGAKFDEPRYMNDGFRPHATIQLKSRLKIGQTVNIDTFSLVDMFPDNDINKRRIIKKFELQ